MNEAPQKLPTGNWEVVFEQLCLKHFGTTPDDFIEVLQMRRTLRAQDCHAGQIGFSHGCARPLFADWNTRIRVRVQRSLTFSHAEHLKQNYILDIVVPGADAAPIFSKPWTKDFNAVFKMLKKPVKQNEMQPDERKAGGREAEVLDKEN